MINSKADVPFVHNPLVGKLKTKTIKVSISHKIIRKEIREAKEKWMYEKCNEKNQLNNKHDELNTHKTSKKPPVDLDKTILEIYLINRVILNSKLMKNWERGKSILNTNFHDEQRPGKPNSDAVEGSHVTLSEVKRAINLMKNIEATSPDKISTDLFKIMKWKTLSAFFNTIYDSAEILEKSLISTFFTLPKKFIANSYTDFRSISLLCHMLKILLVYIKNVRKTTKRPRLGSVIDWGFAKRYLQLFSENFRQLLTWENDGAINRNRTNGKYIKIISNLYWN